MKRTTEYVIILTISTVILSGCANKINCEPTYAPATQPATQPACTCVVDEDVVCEVVDESFVPVEERPAITREFDRQVHNAELADMSLADMHFLPNRAALNSTGTQRLSHLAWLVDNYGGTIKLDLKDTKGELTNNRLATVKSYLKSWGLADDKIKVEIGLPDNEGMSAQEAIKVYEGTRYQKKDKRDSNN